MRGSDRCHAHSGASVGRPTELNDAVQQKLCDALRAGNYLEAAGPYAGVSRSTVYRWLAQANQEGADPRLVEFRDAVRSAEAQAEVHAVGVIRQGIAHGDARIALAYLERRHPQRWRNRNDNGGTPAGRTAQQPADLDTDDPKARALLSELLRHRQTAR
jgi:hypothetical protein